MHFFRPHLFILLLIFVSCKTSYNPTAAEYTAYRVTADRLKDSAMQTVMKPYRDSVNNSMNVIVGRAESTLERKQPEGTLGNFTVDAMWYGARQKFGIPIDAAFVNNGGVRITQLPAGPVSRGKIFELMPFDNLLIVQKLSGAVLQQFLNLIAADGGWPVAGVQFAIKEGKAVNVTVGGAPLNPNKVYTIANSDYVANGGENAAMLKTIPQQNVGYLMRDAIFNYIDHLKAQGKNISANLQNRITDAQ